MPLKSRLSTGGGTFGGATTGENPTARERLSRYAGIRPMEETAETPAVEEVDSREVQSSDEQSREAIADSQTELQFGGDGQTYTDAAPETQKNYGPQHGTEPEPPKTRKPRTPRQATPVVKEPARPQYASAADVRQALKEHEADVKAMRLRHAEELQSMKAKHVDLSTKLFDFVSQ